MGSFNASAYREAGKSHTCADCGASIIRYHTYLSYALRQRKTVPVCLICSTKIDEEGFIWDCQVVRARIAMLGCEDALYRNLARCLS